MEILMYITDCPDRVISGSPLALNMPDDEGRQEFLEIFAETFEAGVMQMKNGDHIVVRKNKSNLWAYGYSCVFPQDFLGSE